MLDNNRKQVGVYVCMYVPIYTYKSTINNNKQNKTYHINKKTPGAEQGGAEKASGNKLTRFTPENVKIGKRNKTPAVPNTISLHTTTDGRTNGQTDRRVNVQMDGWMNGCFVRMCVYSIHDLGLLSTLPN